MKDICRCYEYALYRGDIHSHQTAVFTETSKGKLCDEEVEEENCSGARARCFHEWVEFVYRYFASVSAQPLCSSMFSCESVRLSYESNGEDIDVRSKRICHLCDRGMPTFDRICFIFNC